MVKELPLYTVDAFTENTFGGNPAAVVLLESDDEISDQVKQKIATEMNLSETVYLSKLDKRIDFQTGNTFGIRWFTPQVEVTLCGHATLAASKVIFDVLCNKSSRLNLETKHLGTVYSSHQNDGTIVLDFPNHKPRKIWHNRYDALIKVVIGDLPFVDLQFGFETRKLLIRLDDKVTRSELEAVKPNFQEMIKMEDTLIGVIVTVRGSSENGCIDRTGQDVYDFASRYFAPFAGINEDPVCGSAHAVLAPYWGEILHSKELRALQCSPRVGELHLTVRDDGRVDIAGKAKTVIRGTIQIE